ncbi:PIKK family atypical protein kinase [Trichomonas vaginalis G3]|uniref:Serine/threonine-protein kinase TOR n=1 Tax=Trichomonas vaginalis (strain ATCC PRA-98 / G3) TaxID=412133 RepID=A2DG61_TRIV3|nr:ataxia telangiectasia mutated (ATM) -related family [Trichomonas vaginalis G3]EAY20688.1 PIKK family atypical protein kinase [Trichomonas vaginalis G3]KAI5487408.1 ataxia telangiectasia mutated (ATM) -related family [Trichomonas vaginalis G3]|eukprot:XP_001581674.1 PIKK family atypical protein kinase [Trichomonas vaginalis G3]
MNLSSYSLPNTYEEMKKQYDKYYFEFYHEMVRMSNISLTEYIEKYLQLVESLAKSSKPEDAFRTAIAINSLHSFGYNNFTVLSNLFDRIIPQKEIELVKFTSWVAGNLIHHPNLEQSHYVSHLINRLIGWLHSHGRRERHLAAAWMIYELSDNAGSSVVIYLSSILSASNILLVHQSTRVSDATIAAYSAFTTAVLRYRRSELLNYLEVLSKLSLSLLTLNDPAKQNAAIRLLTCLIVQVNDYFTPFIQNLCGQIEYIYETSTPLVQSNCLCLESSISYADSAQFMDYFGDNYFTHVKEMILEFTTELTNSLIQLSKFVPDFVLDNMESIKEIANSLVNHEMYSEAFSLLSYFLQFDPDSFVPFDSSLAHKLVQAPLSINYRDFFLVLTSLDDIFPDYILNSLFGKLQKELTTETPLFSLQLIANMPSEYFPPDNQLLMMVLPFTTSRSVSIRKTAPKAIFNILQSNESISAQSIVLQELQRAMSDLDLSVRCAVLESIAESCLEELATPKALEMLKVFVNDDAYSVRIETIKILGNLIEINPMTVTGIIRQCIIDYFYALKNITSIRQRGRIGRLLPHIFRAGQKFIKVYTDIFLEVFFDVMSQNNVEEESPYINFIEENNDVTLKIGLIESLPLFAVNDKDKIENNIEQIVNDLCSYLQLSMPRALILAVLRCLFDLLTPPAASVAVRSTCATIFNACSALLYITVSRKTRIAILRVFGAIGVLDLHPTNPPITTPLPDNIDEDLARKFFQPSRDSDTEIDESYLLDKRKEEIYIGHYVMMSLVNILMDISQKDYHAIASEAIVKVIQPQKLWMLPLIDYFANQLLNLLNTSKDDDTKSRYVEILIPFIYKAGNVIVHFVPQIFNFVLNNVQKKRYLSLQQIKIILALVVSIRDAFTPISHSLFCLLIESMDNSKTSDLESALLILQIFEQLNPYTFDQANLIVNQVCDAIICDKTIPEVVVASLKVLSSFAPTHNLMPFIGMILRSMRTSIFSENQAIKAAGIEMMTVFVKSYGKPFLFSASPIMTQMMAKKLTSDEFISVVTSVEVGTYNVTTPVPQKPNVVPLDNSNSGFSFNEDLIMQKLSNPSFGEESYLRQWLINLTRLMISTNPKLVIRECTSISQSSETFTLSMFNIVFLTVWDELSKDGKEMMAKTILAILESKETYEQVGRILLTLLVFMHKIQKDIPISKQSVVNASMKYGYYSFALKLQEELYKPTDKKALEKIINIYLELGQRPNALAIYNMCKTTLKDPVILTKLQLYDQSVEYLKNKFRSKSKDPNTFISLIESYCGLNQWKSVIDFTDEFEKQQRSIKTQSSPLLAEAALHLGKWDMLEQFLEFSPEDNFHCNIMIALHGLHTYLGERSPEQYQKISSCIDHGFSLIASRPFSFWAEHQKVHKEIVLQAQKLVEIEEMMKYMNSTDKIAFEKNWAQRLVTAPRNFHIWFELISNRVCITKTRDENLIKFFLLKSPEHNAQIHMNTFNILFPEYNERSAPFVDRLCNIIARYNCGEKEKAIQMISEMLPQTKDTLRCQCLYLYSSWLIETKDSFDSLLTAYQSLGEAAKLTGNNKIQRRLSSENEHSSRRISRVTSSFTEYTFTQSTFLNLTSNVMRAEVLRKWAFVAAELIENGQNNVDSYVTTAISCLTECVNQDASFPDVVQLLNIFFDHADHPDVFSKTSESIENLPPQLLLKSTLQLLVQLSHPSRDVANFVHDIIFKMLKQHYHAIIFSIIVMEESSNERRCRVASNLFQEFQAAMPQEASEVILIRDALLRVSVTWYDWLRQFVLDIKDAISDGRWNDIVESIDDIVQTTKTPTCLLEEVVKQQFANELSQAEHLLETFTPSSHFHMNSLISWRNSFESALAIACRDIKYIELQSISQELCQITHFKLAVPGTYKPEKEIIRIQYFIEQLMIYDTKQQPKSLVIKGEDGSMYQYLLKGHEDLRLDERVMQFFRLVNSILKKECVMKDLLLHTMSVIPISSTNGLVQWVPGTDTLRSVIDQYRKIRKFDEKQDEFKMLEQTMYISYDNMMPIQKLQIFNNFCRINPDTDIASFFWLKATDAEHWLKMIDTFATSNSINDAIGYVIGLGDRHPGNILIDKITGKVVHIDFGDCFEKAMNRPYLPEVVPFRLTRMMVKAMGLTGYNGIFKSSFSDILAILRENWRVLILVLAIFVHEPLIEVPDSPSVRRRKPAHKVMDTYMAGGKRIGIPRSESMTDEIRSVVKSKLTGTDMAKKKRQPLTVEQQTELLINSATSAYNLSKMYSGWAPFW